MKDPESHSNDKFLVVQDPEVSCDEPIEWSPPPIRTHIVESCVANRQDRAVDKQS